MTAWSFQAHRLAKLPHTAKSLKADQMDVSQTGGEVAYGQSDNKFEGFLCLQAGQDICP